MAHKAQCAFFWVWKVVASFHGLRERSAVHLLCGMEGGRLFRWVAGALCGASIVCYGSGRLFRWVA